MQSGPWGAGLPEGHSPRGARVADFAGWHTMDSLLKYSVARSPGAATRPAKQVAKDQRLR